MPRRFRRSVRSYADPPDLAVIQSLSALDGERQLLVEPVLDELLTKVCDRAEMDGQHAESAGSFDVRHLVIDEEGFLGARAEAL